MPLVRQHWQLVLRQSLFPRTALLMHRVSATTTRHETLRLAALHLQLQVTF